MRYRSERITRRHTNITSHKSFCSVLFCFGLVLLTPTFCGACLSRTIFICEKGCSPPFPSSTFESDYSLLAKELLPMSRCSVRKLPLRVTSLISVEKHKEEKNMQQSISVVGNALAGTPHPRSKYSSSSRRSTGTNNHRFFLFKPPLLLSSPNNR